MKKSSITLIAAFSLGVMSLSAQSAIEALQVTQNDFKGTARFMGMGGAFTALGGDLSAIRLNPGGIGIYRSSEVAATLDIDFQKSETQTPAASLKETQTKAYCNNFGYVGTVNLSGALQTFSWGVTYNRAVSFDRRVSAYAYPINTSLTNYIAALTQGVNLSDMTFSTGYNPYFDSNIDWLSILGYNSYLINNMNGSLTNYSGIFGSGTESDADMFVQEKGYVDNYQFTFGGNINNIVYWGAGIGLDDLRYHRFTSYSESMADANIYSSTTASGTTKGSAEYYLDNEKLIKGTGWNLSFGVIVKPIQELRIGAAIHSPTWYNLDEQHVGSVEYDYNPYQGTSSLKNQESTDEAYFNWKLRAPWKFNLGVAGVLFGKAIVSFDYERQIYSGMTMQIPVYDNWGYITGYNKDSYLNDEIDRYSQDANSIRIGAEYRLTPNLSVRAGYNCQLSQIEKDYQDGNEEVLTASTDPSYSFNKTANYVSAGLGYQYKNFYADATYVHKNAKSTLHPFTSYDKVVAPKFDVTENNNSLVLSIGFKF